MERTHVLELCQLQFESHLCHLLAVLLWGSLLPFFCLSVRVYEIQFIGWLSRIKETVGRVPSRLQHRSGMSDSSTPWTAACQTPLSMGILYSHPPSHSRCLNIASCNDWKKSAWSQIAWVWSYLIYYLVTWTSGVYFHHCGPQVPPLLNGDKNRIVVRNKWMHTYVSEQQ